MERIFLDVHMWNQKFSEREESGVGRALQVGEQGKSTIYGTHKMQNVLEGGVWFCH